MTFDEKAQASFVFVLVVVIGLLAFLWYPSRTRVQKDAFWNAVTEAVLEGDDDD